jgi:hypothetical protein
MGQAHRKWSLIRLRTDARGDPGARLITGEAILLSQSRLGAPVAASIGDI